jgi:hypothetical protein
MGTNEWNRVMERNLEDGEYNDFCILRDYYLIKHNISVEQAEFMAEQELERLKGGSNESYN